ncbi:MAG TPA: glycosyltransferase family 4 protein [Oligoflexia bacterium]|nr:glycosyltransferase family 4 protein [Oligoflexia bacterium]
MSNQATFCRQTSVSNNSRTEAMGKVLLEAMAHEKPVIAARVDGIPHYVTDMENGLLFEKENAADLAQRLRMVLANPQLSAALGKRGRERLRSQLSEQEYVRCFNLMIEQVLVQKQQ